MASKVIKTARVVAEAAAVKFDLESDAAFHVTEGSFLPITEERGSWLKFEGWVAKEAVSVCLPPPGPVLRAMDVSDYSGDISAGTFARVRELHDVSGVVIQIYGGRSGRTRGVNRFLESQLRAASEAGLWVAGYIWPPNAVHLAEVRPWLEKPWLFLALDVEAKAGVKRSDVEKLKEFHQRVVIYTSRSQWASIMKNSKEFTDIALWEALWPREFWLHSTWTGKWPVADTPKLWQSTIPSWQERVVWQFTGTVRLEGILADLNVVKTDWLFSEGRFYGRG